MSFARTCARHLKLKTQGSWVHRERPNPAWGLLTVAVVTLAGCNDKRIPLATYLAQQETPPQAVGPDGVAATQPAAAIEPWAPGPYKLGPGDVISINVSGLGKLNMPVAQQARVTEKGDVILPMVGRVQVGGMSLDQAEAQIKAQYVPKYLKETDVFAQVVNYEPVGIMVMGDVIRLSGGAQQVELRRDKASVLQALLAGGGAQDYGGTVTVIPAKNPGNPVSYDLSNRADLVRAAQIGSVEQSDIVLVNARQNDAVYVEGLVNAPGPIPLPRQARLTVLQALGAAGGTMLAFEPREATLMRHDSAGALVTVAVNLDRLKAGQDPDIPLEAGDILLVPHNASTRIEEYIARSLQFRIGTGIETTYNPWTLYYLRKSNEIGRGGGVGYYDTLRNALQTGIIAPFTTPVTPTATPTP